MIRVHHLNNSRSHRVLWLLEELGVPYEVVRYERDAKSMLAPASLRAVHPLGKSPVITDGERTIAESGAIIEYLVDTYGEGRLAPARGTDERLRYTYWLHYAEGSAMPLFVMKLVFSKLAPRSPWLVRPVVKALAANVGREFLNPQIATHMQYWDDTLRAHPWFAGADFSAADIQMSFPIEAAASRAGGKPHPAVADFLTRIRARPAYQKAIETGGPYEMLT